MPFSCSFFGALKACSNPPKTGSKSFSGVGCCPPLKEATQGLTRANKWDFCVECLWDVIQQAGESGWARLQRASASSGVAAPQGCGTYSLVTAWSFLRRHAVCSKHGNIRVTAGEHIALRKSAQKRLEVLLLGRDATHPQRIAHSGSQGQTRGVLCRVSVGWMIHQAGGCGCARLQCASVSSGFTAPQGFNFFPLARNSFR